MGLRWPLAKTYDVTCPDGSVKTVYRNIDKAFPLYIQGWQADLAGNVKLPEIANAELRAKYESPIQGLLYGLDELNHGLMITFRAAYMAYKTDACHMADFFARQVEKLLEEQARLRSFRVQIDGLIALAKTCPERSEKFLDIFTDLVQRMGSSGLPDASVFQIASARKAATDIRGEKDAS